MSRAQQKEGPLETGVSQSQVPRTIPSGDSEYRGDLEERPRALGQLAGPGGMTENVESSNGSPSGPRVEN